MATNPSRADSEPALWTQDENEQLVQWLEEPQNLRKLRKGSRVLKKMIIADIATQIPTKPAIKIGYKYDNLMKSYRAAAKLNNQSGWGLTEEDLDAGRRSLRGIFYFYFFILFHNIHCSYGTRIRMQPKLWCKQIGRAHV